MAVPNLSGKWLAARRFAKQSPPKFYLCNWYVKLVRPGKEIPSNQVQCHVPMKMTKFDIKNYFKRIYGLDIYRVNTRIQIGKEKRSLLGNKRVKKPDVKVAYLTLSSGEFQFPDMFSKYRSNPNQP